MSNFDVSIIIVNWNTRDVLKECLASVFEQTRDVCFEVIVIDNASVDGSAEMIHSNFPQVILIKNEQNRGFATANNQGMRIAKGKFVLLLNSDTVVLDGAIQKTIAFAKQHPDAAAVGCKVLNPDMTLQPTCFMYPSILNMLLSSSYLYKIFQKSNFFGRERMSWWNRNDQRQVDVVTGCFMLVRQEAIKAVGTMDERFFMYGEETDWCYRFKQAGWVNLFDPDAQIIHLGGQSSKKIAIDMALQLRGGILQFINKHRPRWEYDIACILVWLFCGVRIPYWFIRFLFSKQDRKYNWDQLKIYAIIIWRIMTKGGKALCVYNKVDHR